MHTRAHILLITCATGCASVNQGNTAQDDVGSDARVEMIVLNRTQDVVTVFAWWENGARVRLGELRGGATRTFITPLRDTGVWLSLDVLSQRRTGRGDRPDSFVPIRTGDRFEWEIRLVSPSVDLYYRRLPPRPISEAPPVRNTLGETLYQQACDGGDMTSCDVLGLMYSTGEGVPQDLTRALVLFQRACDGGQMPGCDNLGIMYEAGAPVPPDPARAARLYQRACDGGRLSGCGHVGLLYETGVGVTQDTRRAAGLYQRACDGGVSVSCSNLGRMYENGLSVPQDRPRARALFQQACDGGEVGVCTELGIMYATGSSVTQDLDRARTLYQQACEGADMLGCTHLAIMYATGTSAVRDLDRARGLFQRACDGGELLSCTNLGQMYEGGIGVTPDPDRALRAYRRACEGGGTLGCDNLGRMFRETLLERLPVENRILVIGSEAFGSLTDADSESLDGSYLRAWTLGLAANQEVTVDLTSSDFDAYLWVTGPGLEPELSDNDGGGGCNARITFTAPETGRYRAIVNTVGAGVTGDFVLRASDIAPRAAPGPCTRR